jgi:hypothetical protein
MIEEIGESAIKNSDDTLDKKIENNFKLSLNPFDTVQPRSGRSIPHPSVLVVSTAVDTVRNLF